MRGRTKRAKMLDDRQWRHHLENVCRCLAAEALEDNETEFVNYSLSDG